MKINKTIKNVSSLGLLQIFNYLLPLLTVPYLLLKLGAEENGYLITSQTIVSYCALIIEYGFVLTASKKVALYKKSEEIEELFSSVFYSKVFLFLLTLLVLIVVSFTLDNQALIICVLIGSLQIVGNLFNPIWLFQGTENADVLAKINITTRTIFYLLIFVVVRSSDDLYIAIFLLSIPHLVIGIICFYRAKNFFGVKIVMVSISKILLELKEGFYGFWVTVMNFTYTASGILFLGVFSTQEIVGVYGTIEKLIRAGIQVFTPIIQGLYPRMVKLLEENKIKQYKKVMFSCFGVAIVLGVLIIVLSPIISRILLQDLSSNYAITTLRILAFWFSLNSINIIIGVWLFFAKGKMKTYSIIYSIATVFCVALHLIFIPIFGVEVVPKNLIIGELSVMVFFYAVMKRGLI